MGIAHADESSRQRCAGSTGVTKTFLQGDGSQPTASLPETSPCSGRAEQLRRLSLAYNFPVLADNAPTNLLIGRNTPHGLLLFSWEGRRYHGRPVAASG